MGFLKQIFTWWDGATIGTSLHIRRHGRQVGTDESGNVYFAQFHVWVPAEWTVREAHDKLDRVEEQLQERFPGTEILIHLDPEGQTDRETLLPSAITERAS